MSHVDRVLEQWGRERPDLDLAPMGLIGRLTRVARHLNREMEAGFGDQGLTMASFDVLASLRRAGAPFRLSAGELVASTMVTSGTITHRVDQLVKAGYVERVENPDDGRGVLIALTARGRAVVDRAVAAHAANLERLTAGLSESEFRRLDRLLGRYLDVLEGG
ncbi:MAG: MarR family winged helix-turn-helix transcriptional regulator [Phycisphaerales bacterium]